jgi:glycosyltransferase involved in cell wall biosynthesis
MPETHDPIPLNFEEFRLPQATRPLRIAMLLTNPCTNDSRVIKEAEALAGMGHTVTVFCRMHHSVTEPIELRNGVTYYRLEMFSRTRRPIKTDPGHALSAASDFWRCLWAGGMFAFMSIMLSNSPTASANATSLQGTGRLVFVERAAFSISKLGKKIGRDASRGLRFASRISKKALLLPFYLFERFVFSRLMNGVRNYLRPYFIYNGFTRSVRKTVRGWRPDVVHCHDLATLPAGVAITRGTDAKLIFDAHEYATLEIENEAWLTNWYKRRTERRCLKHIDGMITVSDGFARTFQEEYGVERPTVILNTQMFYRQSTLGGRTVRQDLGFDASVPLAVYLGGLNPRRALRQLMEALAQMPWLHFAKVGGRTVRWEELLIDTAEELGCRDRLHILDAVPPEEIIHYIKDGDFGIVPRIRFSIQQGYSMPNKLFESVFGGLPIAYGQTEEMHTFVDRFKLGIPMDCLDPNDIVRAVTDLYNRREDFKPSPEKIREILVDYGWPAQANRLFQLYEHVEKN